MKEVLSSSLRERDKEREQHIRTEQECNYESLLQNLIRDPSISWKDAKRILRKDPSWEEISNVFDRSEREEIFKNFIIVLTKKSRDQFYKLLNETNEVSFYCFDKYLIFCRLQLIVRGRKLKKLLTMIIVLKRFLAKEYFVLDYLIFFRKRNQNLTCG